MTYDPRDYEDGALAGRIEVIPDPPTIEFDQLRGLAILREPIPADQIEKLPKPLWKGAWDGERAARCSTCHGYHVLSNAIHLDYCGHALTTNRLLDADPYWDWEPLALTDQGLPQFDKVGGLWIKLTVCGVTRLGYGDGASPKEIIGDAIRNAAMRFGVALDLWSKADLHMDRNPGDGPTHSSQGRGTNRNDRGGGSDNSAPAGVRGVSENAPTAAAAPNEEALLALGDVCDDHGYDRRGMRAMYAQWSERNLEFADRTDLAEASSEHIYAFAAKLIEDATVEPDDGTDDGAGSADDASMGGAGEEGDEVVGAVAEGASPVLIEGVLRAELPDPNDTSDVEKGPDDIF